MKITLRELRQIVKTVIKEEKKSIKQENVINTVNAKLQGIAAGLGARLRTDKNNAQIQKYATEILTHSATVAAQLSKLFYITTKFKNTIDALKNANPDSGYKQQLEEFVNLTTKQIAAIQMFDHVSNQFESAIKALQQNANSQGVANKQAATAQTTTPAASTTQAK